MTKNQKLEYIFSTVRKDYPKRKLVFNDGSPDAKIMIIGEAPGKVEEIQGKPFVGRAGKLLNSTLETLGWKRDDFYISNIVKYRPQDSHGGTLTPTKKEIAKFREAIEKEIAIVEPRLIVVLGRIAMTGLNIEGTMAQNHGKVLEQNGHKILVAYHPAAILRNPNWEPVFKKDLTKLKNLAD